MTEPAVIIDSNKKHDPEEDGDDDGNDDEKKDASSLDHHNGHHPRNELESLEYSRSAAASHDDYDDDDGDSYTAFAESSVTGHAAHFHRPSSSTDATRVVQEMHLALLYLLSHPEEFHRALTGGGLGGAMTTLAQWNADYHADNESLVGDGGGASIYTSTPYYDDDNADAPQASTPLPLVVFADDAEVVLPQAHTASQLFGIERVDGIELEAAAGIPAISQLFLRWLALMPGGDHLNIIDPPGLTVMRIAGGRYRVTAAHRVVWTWSNNFCPIDDIDNHQEGGVDALQLGDLVTMTIVDVFETDNHGKLLSYCPTFDNRAVHKTLQSTETLLKSRSKLVKALQDAQRSKLAKLVLKQATCLGNMVKQTVSDVASKNTSFGGSLTTRKRADSSGPAFSDAAMTDSLQESSPS